MGLRSQDSGKAPEARGVVRGLELFVPEAPDSRGGSIEFCPRVWAESLGVSALLGLSRDLQ
jgi:hypothetical protein